MSVNASLRPRKVRHNVQDYASRPPIVHQTPPLVFRKRMRATSSAISFRNSCTKRIFSSDDNLQNLVTIGSMLICLLQALPNLTHFFLFITPRIFMCDTSFVDALKNRRREWLTPAGVRLASIFAEGERLT